MRRLINFVRRGIESSELDIFENGIVKQECLLCDEADLRAQRFLGNGAQVAAIDLYHSGGRIVQAQDERENRALASATRSNQGIAFSRFDSEVQIADRVSGGICIAKRDILKVNPALRRREHGGIWRILHSRLRVKNLEDPGRGGD